MYTTEVIDYYPQATKMAQQLEETINRICKEQPVEFVSFSITNSAKTILVFRTIERS
jgi:hypothetical protein